MSRNPRNRSGDRATNASPRRGGASTKDRNNNASSSISNIAGMSTSAMAANNAVPETPAEMSERLRLERLQTLSDLTDKSDSHVTAEMIGFALAKEIGERACDLYINTTYDELANEYTAEALWDEMMDSIGAFAQAVPSSLPFNADGKNSIYADPLALLQTPNPNRGTTTSNASTGRSSPLTAASSSPSGSRPSSARSHSNSYHHPGPQTAAGLGFVKRLPPPGILPPVSEEIKQQQHQQHQDEKHQHHHSKVPSNPTVSAVAAKSALKSSTTNKDGGAKSGENAGNKDTTAAAGGSSPGAEPKKRRVRLTVTEPEEEKEKQQQQQQQAQEPQETPMKDRKLSAREQLQAAVEEKLKEDKERKEQELARSPHHAQIALAKLDFDLEPPGAADPSWLPDEPPLTMFCDLTARHAAGLKLKTVDPAQLANSLGISQDSGLEGTMAGLAQSSTVVMGATGRMGRSMTLGGTTGGGTGGMRRSMIGGSHRPGSGTVIGGSGATTRSGSNSGNQSGQTRPLSPTQLALGEVSKDSVPIHILTHNLSMMASASPYLAMKKKQEQQAKMSSEERTRHWSEDGAPPPTDYDYIYNKITGMPPTSRGGDTAPGGGDSSNIEGGSGGIFGENAPPGGEIPSIPIPDAQDHESSAFESIEDDDDSIQSPSEQEVAQRIQLRQAQRTRNATAFNTISNQLAELTNPKSSSNQQQVSTFGGGHSSSPSSGHASTTTAPSGNQTSAADKNLIVDARLGRVIPVTSVEAAGGGKKHSSRSNPLTESPRYNVQMPAPPPTEPPANSREARLARRQAALQNRSSAPSSHTDQGQSQQRTASRSYSPSAGSDSYSPFRNNKKKKRRDNDPSNFFEPEAKVPPMVQMLNPSGGVAVKDDSGARRNERAHQPLKVTKEDYKKMIRMAPTLNNNNLAASEFGWGAGGTSSPMNVASPTSGGEGFSFKQQQQPQTARNESKQQQQQSTTSGSKTARR